MTKKAESLIKLQAKLAGLEAEAELIRIRIQRLESGEKLPPSGVDLIWEAALDKSRERSSRFKCRKAWLRIPADERPDIEEAVAALKIWNRCEDWTKNAYQFAPALDRWITERKWQDTPKVRDPMAVYKAPSKPVTTIEPSAAAEDRAALDEFLKQKLQ